MLFRQANCKLPTFGEVYICIFKLYHDKEVSKKNRTQYHKHNKGRKEGLQMYLCEFWLQMNGAGLLIFDSLQL